MPAKFSKFYQSYSRWAPVVFSGKLFTSMGRVRKLSLLNRLRDYLALNADSELLELHRALNQHLHVASQSWESYDYGQGYFYQSLDRVGIRGLRDTQGRVKTMKLRERLAGCNVLEIGSNTGFVALSLIDVVDRVVGFDINSHLIDISNEVAKFLNCQNADFLTTTFEQYQPEEKFDAVLSFANHSTFDGNTQQSLSEYFSRCRESMKSGGLLLFESHPPAFEKQGLEKVCELIEQCFRIEERTVLNYGTYLDRGRTFVSARAA
jgi:SAM-dependent methyltransferase